MIIFRAYGASKNENSTFAAWNEKRTLEVEPAPEGETITLRVEEPEDDTGMSIDIDRSDARELVAYLSKLLEG